MNYPSPYLGRLLAALFASAILPQLSAIPVWINEIHYDNDGADKGEFVEVAGKAGSDLSGHSLLFYNGNGGATYNPSVPLSGLIPNETNGFGALSFLRAGIQNGAPDGIALIGPGNSVIQFLSYEGSFTAVGGAAAGLTSIDIGVKESTSTPVGSSLQLIGSGSAYSDFIWSVPSLASPGQVNSGQSFEMNSVSDAGSSALLLGIGLSGMLLFKRRRQN